MATVSPEVPMGFKSSIIEAYDDRREVEMVSRDKTLIDELMETPGKAEIINGEIVLMAPTGGDPGYAGDEIYSSLRQHVKATGIGRAI
jgi:hypothetical protein